jgi:DNA-binding SARP family transcriptional activator
VLALLVANAGRVVSLAALVEGLWGEHAPPDAARTARTYVSRLRKTLLPAAAGMTVEGLIVTRPPGYALRLDPDAVDAARFERLAAAGRQALAAGQPAVAAERLAAALGLWRGDAYGEFGDTAALSAEGARLERLRLTAVEDLSAARDAWQHALTILEDLDHPDADQVRAKLQRLDQPATTVSHPPMLR